MDLEALVAKWDYLSSVSDFQQQVYAVTKCIPKGKVATYGTIAEILQSSPRAVGQALKKNPFAPRVPCHRVVAKNGLGGFFGATSGSKIADKVRLLKSEGAFNEDDEPIIISARRLRTRILKRME